MPNQSPQLGLLQGLKSLIQFSKEDDEKEIIDFAVESWLEFGVYFKLFFEDELDLVQITIMCREFGNLATTVVHKKEKPNLNVLRHLDLSYVLFEVTDLLKDASKDNEETQQEEAPPELLSEEEKAECLNAVLELINSEDSVKRKLAAELIAAFKDRFEVYEEMIGNTITNKEHSEFILTFIHSHR